MKVFDCFPFAFEAELDILEVRLHELAPVVDEFLIIESRETFGGQEKPAHLEASWDRFKEFHDKIIYWKVDGLLPPCIDLVSGRKREACQRNILKEMLHLQHPKVDDIIMLSDCDEIPRRTAVEEIIKSGKLLGLRCDKRVEGPVTGIHRFKQRSYYYNVNTQVDYGHDFASRARIGLWADVQHMTMYEFRHFMPETCPGIEGGGWHFGYFGGVDRIKTKVDALTWHPDYRLGNVEADIKALRDIHGRQFVTDMLHFVNDDDLPEYLLAHRNRFKHFWRFPNAGTNTRPNSD